MAITQENSLQNDASSITVLHVYILNLQQNGGDISNLSWALIRRDEL